MAQLNQAYEVIQGEEDPTPTSGAGQPGAKPSSDPGLAEWSDANTACDICGWGPATQVTFNSVTGIILFWRWHTFDAKLCHFCGIAMYNESQRNTLLKGWWGIIAPLATVVAFLGNLGRVGAVKRLPLPQGRCPSVYALVPVPLIHSKAWFKSPASLIATAVALVIVVSIVSSILSPPRSPGSPSTTTPAPATDDNSSVDSPSESSGGVSGLLNTCWQDSAGTQVEEVACGSSAADWVAYTETQDPSICSASYLDADGGWYVCLRPA